MELLFGPGKGDVEEAILLFQMARAQFGFDGPPWIGDHPQAAKTAGVFRAWAEFAH
jgi:hypothetical protein